MLKADLTKLYTMGFDFWRVPLCANEKLLEDIVALIKQETLVERLMGDRLKREQLNFMYEAMECLFEGLARRKFIARGQKIVWLAIPELVALKSLVRINEVFQRKFVEATEGIKYKRHEIDPPKPLIEFALITSKNPHNPVTHQDLLP